MSSRNGKGSEVVFGVTAEEYGLAEDISIAEEADKAEIENGQGEVVGTIHFKQRTKVTATYTPLSSSSIPMVGSKVTLGGMAGVILDSVEKKSKRGAVQTWAISGYFYPSIIITP